MDRPAGAVVLRRFVKRHLLGSLPARVRRLLMILIRLPGRIRCAAASRGIFRSTNHRRVLSLRERHAGQRCFIIGSGPSITGMDLGPLRQEVTFGFNAFYLIADTLGFLPTYYLIEDQLPAEDNAARLCALRGTTKIFPTDLRYCLRPDPDTVYVHFDRLYADHPQERFPRFSEDALRCVYWGGTVAYMALQLAFYMGIREVYLIGIDLSYRVPPVMEGTVITSREEDVNHFHPAYFGPGKRWHDPNVDRMRRSFEYASAYYAARGRAVYNATVGGALHTLLRRDYHTLF